MTSCILLYIALFVLHLGTFTYAIYDPRVSTTIKPPNRREPSLPWYLNEKDPQPPQDLARSAKWWSDNEETATRKPIIVNSDNKSWTAWRKNPGSEIEQRSEITQDQIHEQSQFDQTDSWKPPPENDYGYSTTSKEGLVQGNENRGNDLPGKESTKLSLDNDQEFLYEGVPIDSTKPRKERILFSTTPKLTIALYDPASGVQCPTPQSTGQFVYPLDCKFFVNCWKGRAFVQPCAPGTLFNPETLECDFPHKVQCYGSEILDLTHYSNSYTLPPSAVEGRAKHDRCGSHVTGLIAHPTNCTKFLQCVNGASIEMDCGPGTVFNPAISVCDWPRNVKGCEDVFNSEGNTGGNSKLPDVPEDPEVSYNSEPSFHDHRTDTFEDSLRLREEAVEKKAECPSHFTGFLPHPETCRKFLQCEKGMTYVMDCGPGTAFNPTISVCDWPYNVPACKAEKTSKPKTTTARPWPHHGVSGSRHEDHRHDHIHNNQWGQGSWNNGQIQPIVTTVSPKPTSPSTYHPVTWRPIPDYNRRVSQNQHVPATTDNPKKLPSDHYHEHIHHHDHYMGSEHSMNEDNCNHTSQEGPHGQGPYGQQMHHHHYHRHHHRFNYGPHLHNDETSKDNRPTSESTQETSKHDHPYPNGHSSPWRPTNGRYVPKGQDRIEVTSTIPPDNIRRIGEEVPTHRTDHGRLSPEFANKEENQSNSLNKNIYVGSNFKLPDESEPGNRTNRTFGTVPGPYFRPNQINNTWNRTRTLEKPTNLLETFNRPNNRPWNQEEPPFPVYYVPPVKPLTHSKISEPLTPISGQIIRLRGGSGPGDGYLEVQGAQPGWGIVCDSSNSWTLKEAHVVCRQLGYTGGAVMAWQGRNNRKGMPTWIAANSVTCYGNETRFQSCKFRHGQECRVDRDAVGVRCVPNRVAHCRKDEIPHEGQCYHLADSDKGLNHAEALQYCSKRGGRLIDITNQAENNFVSDWLVQLHPEIGSIMTSGVGFTTFNRTLWLWEDSSRAKFKYAKWWPGWANDRKLPPWVGARPACIIMKRKFPCQNHPDSICVGDYFFWDIEDCASSMKGHSYICKRPYDDIGCVYGKGNQYFGTANVSATGIACLPWSDKKIQYYLTVNVVSNEVREKLKAHNYCRNPIANRGSRPWCFTGPRGEWEYCDIPSCGNIASKSLGLNGQCKPKHFECLPGECIPSPWVCDGVEDCTNGADELSCTSHLDLYQKYAKSQLEGYDVEKWLNTPLKTCAHRCKEADFTCRSFAHKANGNICLLSDSNIGLTGALKPSKDFDYYEMKERSIDCNNMFVCNNRKCINQTMVCNGKNDCNDRSDEKICTAENLDYDIRLAGSENPDEGRIEVKILGVWGQVCDDGFGMINAKVICKELGFPLGALDVKPGGFYGNLEPRDRFMVDQLKCLGNETSLRECDFEGWGVHNCEPEEAVGVVCKTGVDSCPQDQWKCDSSPQCVRTAYICDEVVDCEDGSDENDAYCDAPFELRLVNGSSPLEGRVEVRHHGIWGTVCDDDFSVATARVICRSLGYGGPAKPIKGGFFGPGEGPIWLDEVSCRGNETQLYRCSHNDWAKHNCDHNEDVGVICSLGEVNNDDEFDWDMEIDTPETSINDILPADCGKRPEDFNYDEDLMFARVVQGSIAPKGTYPWQASIRIRGHSRSNHWCGAVVVSPLHVLTAAHCLEGYNKGTYFVRAGDYNTEIKEGTEREANIENYYIHEDFRKGHRMNNDIALVYLKGQGIPLGKDIMPICLPPANAEYPAGLNCTISGFGSIETGKTTPSRDLRYGWVPLLDQSICRAEYVYGQGKISDGMVCAGYLDEGVDTCDGDSGGPLVCHHNGAFTLYGITSWGQHCGEANKPGVYVRVAHYRRWIDQKIKESLSGK